MEKITHNEFQLLIGVAGTVGFFAFTGIAYIINELTTKKK